MLDQPFLAPQAAAITGQTAIRTEHPVARHDDGDLVGTVGARHRAHGGWPFHGGCECRIADDFAHRDLPQAAPDIALEGRALAGKAGFEGG